jgi:hypothetical protein
MLNDGRWVIASSQPPRHKDTKTSHTKPSQGIVRQASSLPIGIDPDPVPVPDADRWRGNRSLSPAAVSVPVRRCCRCHRARARIRTRKRERKRMLIRTRTRTRLRGWGGQGCSPPQEGPIDVMALNAMPLRLCASAFLTAMVRWLREPLRVLASWRLRRCDAANSSPWRNPRRCATVAGSSRWFLNWPSQADRRPLASTRPTRWHPAK